MINSNILHHVHKEGFNQSEIYDAYKIFFGTLFSESRLKIINLLRTGKKNVTEICNVINVEQTAVSHDLTRMKKCGFVNCEIEGKYRYYKLNEKTIEPLMSLIDKHMSQYCIHILRNEKKVKK